MKLWVIVPTYGRPDLLDRCLHSIAEQDDQDYQVAVADDASPGRDVADVLAAAEDRGWQVFRRPVNLGATANIVKAVRWVNVYLNAAPDEVFVIVDGDDYLPHPGCLARIRACYENGALAAYGSYEPDPPSDTCGPAQPIPADILRHGLVRAFTRDVGQWFNHPLSFRRRVFDMLDDSDFQFADGTWMRYGYDRTLFIPILELAGSRVEFCEDVVYRYTSDRPDSTCWAYPSETSAENDWVCSQPRKYRPIEEEPCE